MLHRLNETLRRHTLIDPEQTYLVALSGGADSVALLLALHETGVRLEAAHCNFHLRGDESDRDEAFCRDLCRRLDIPLHITRFDTRREAALTGESIEMAARRLRYARFRSLAAERGLAGICVAHHRDDNAETLLLNLLRGTGPAGMAGMAYCTQGVIRPLLDVTRRDILAFLAERGQDFVTDSTNSDTRYLRNGIRHLLLPLMRRLRPGTDAALLRTARDMRAAQTALDEAHTDWITRNVRAESFGHSADIDALRHPYHGHRWAEHYGLSDEALTDLCAERTADGALAEGRGYTACRYRGRIQIAAADTLTVPVPLTPEGCAALPAGRLRLRLIPRSELEGIPRRSDTVALDADQIDGQLIVRPAASGERFAPFGTNGTALVSDFLAARGLSRLARRYERMVADSSGILWVVGHRIDRRAMITASTQRVALITVEPS